jgi:DNA-binding response OmpR family regulator
MLLLVEDDPTIAHELSLRWRARGWTVQRAATLAEADAAMAVPGRFDLVLLDLACPTATGSPGCRRCAAATGRRRCWC